jgi:DNA-binding protein HU-beta
MNKNEFVNLYSENTGKTKKDSGIDVENFLTTLQEGLVTKGKVSFMDFLTLEIKDTKPRKGHNPQTGEEIDIPAGKRIGLKIGKGLKEAIKG